jgi:hypothetical protein
MTQLTTGRLRFAVRDGAGKEIYYSPSFLASVADNVATPRIYVNSREGTANDQNYTFPQKVSGKRGEVLAVQYLDGAAHTLDTSDMDSTVIPVVEAFRNARNQIDENRRELLLRDRISDTTMGHIQQLNDDGATRANEWSDILRFAPQSGTAWFIAGHVVIEVHDDN